MRRDGHVADDLGPGRWSDHSFNGAGQRRYRDLIKQLGRFHVQHSDGHEPDNRSILHPNHHPSLLIHLCDVEFLEWPGIPVQCVNISHIIRISSLKKCSGSTHTDANGHFKGDSAPTGEICYWFEAESYNRIREPLIVLNLDRDTGGT